MQYDPRGIAVGTQDAAVLEVFERAVMAFLGQRPETGALLGAALAADGGLIPAHALAGFAALLGARRDLRPAAAVSLAAARRALSERGGTDHERALVEALAAWGEDGDMVAAAARLERQVAAAPTDVLALRLAHAIRFMLGDAITMRRVLEGALSAWTGDVAGQAYVLGCHAFALGETGELARAEQVGREAVGREPGDLWGAHAVAHAMGGLARPREGVAWIAWLEPHMACGGSFVRHIHWHRALCHLRLGEPDQALGLYDRRIRDQPSGEVRDILNAASLLWRLEAAGTTVGQERWAELADIAQSRIGDHSWAFADLHYVLCLAGARRQEAVGQMLVSIRSHAQQHDDTQAMVHADIGLATATAIAAALAGDNHHATQLFAATSAQHHRLGGSNAQRDLLRQMHARAGVAARAAAEG